MGNDKLSQYLREFLLESKGRNALIYEEASKLVRMLRRDYANKEITGRLYFDFNDINEEIKFLRPYLPFRFNIQGSHEFWFSIHKFDGDGNIIELNYNFNGKNEIIKLKKPLDLFGYYLNKKNSDSYMELFSYSQRDFPFNTEETKKFGDYFLNLMYDTKNTGDELGRDDLQYRSDIDPSEPYKYCWDEDYLDANDQVRTMRRCEYRLPGNKRISGRSKEI